MKIFDNFLIDADYASITIKKIIKKYESLFDEFDKGITKSYKNKKYLGFLDGLIYLL